MQAPGNQLDWSARPSSGTVAGRQCDCLGAGRRAAPTSPVGCRVLSFVVSTWSYHGAWTSSEAVQEEPMTNTTAAATKPPAPKTTAKATDATPSAHPMAPKPMARSHGEAMLAGLRKPLYAYVGAGDLALEKLREIPTEWSEITAARAAQRGEAASHPDRRAAA